MDQSRQRKEYPLQRGDTSCTSEIFLLGVCAVLLLVVLVVAPRGQQADPRLRQQVLQLAAQQVQQRLHHLRTQLVCIRPAKRRKNAVDAMTVGVDEDGGGSFPSPSADGQYLQQAGGGHLQGGAELRHAGLLQELQRLPQHGLRAAELGENVEEAAGDRQGDVHRLVADAQREHGHQQEALLGFWDGEEREITASAKVIFIFITIHKSTSTGDVP